MNYEIRVFDPAETDIGVQSANLLNTSFGLNFTWEGVVKNTYHNNSIVGSPGSFYLAAMDGDKVVGFTAYKSHDFLYNGEVINCWHHCFVATDAAYRGQRIFPNLLAFGKEEVIRMGGGGFVYGVPNHNSGPVLKRLQYKYHGPFMKANIFNVPGVFESSFANWKKTDVLYDTHSWFQNDYQLFDIKRTAHGETYQLFEDLGNVIWGRVLHRKTGPWNMPYFSVGGMIINKPHFFQQTVKLLMKKYPVAMVQFLFHSSSIYRKLFSRAVETPFAEPFMVTDVNVNTGPKDIFNFMPGIKDHF